LFPFGVRSSGFWVAVGIEYTGLSCVVFPHGQALGLVGFFFGESNFTKPQGRFIWNWSIYFLNSMD
jgi:hypothetical protein